MQVACDATPLKFLAGDQPPKQVYTLLLGGGPLLYFLKQRGVALSKFAGPLSNAQFEFIVRFFSSSAWRCFSVKSLVIFA